MTSHVLIFTIKVTSFYFLYFTYKWNYVIMALDDAMKEMNTTLNQGKVAFH